MASEDSSVSLPSIPLPPQAPAPPQKIQRKRQTFGANVRISANNVSGGGKKDRIPQDRWKKTVNGSNGLTQFNEWINYSPNDSTIFLARDVGSSKDSVTKQYAFAEKWEDLLHDIKIRDPEAVDQYVSRNFYEFFRESQPVKLYFDFELKGPFRSEEDDFVNNNLPLRPTDEDLKGRLQKICQRAMSYIKIVYEVHIEMSWFQVLNSSNNDKISFHVILTKGIYFKDCKHLRDIFRDMFPKKDLNNIEHFPQFIGLDPGVYGNGRMFRLPLCSKLHEKRPLLVPISDDEQECIEETERVFSDFLISYCPLVPFTYTPCDDIGEPLISEDGVEITLQHIPQIVEYIPPLKKTRGSKRKSDEIDDAPKLADTREATLEAMLMSIPVEKADDYDTWIQTGIKLKRAGGTLEMWEDWTHKYFDWLFQKEGRSSNREGKIRSRWDGFDSSNDIHLFLEHVKQYGDKTLVDAYRKNALEFIGLLHNEIGQVFHISHPQHVFSNGTWWYFNGVKWKRDSDSMWISRSILHWQIEISKKIGENKNILEQYGVGDEEEDEETTNKKTKRDDTSTNGDDTESLRTGARVTLTPEQKAHVDYLKKFNKKLRQIKKITQDGTIGNNNALKTIYFNDLFYDELDTYHDLLGFDNGVYDLVHDEFRPSTPLDRMTLSVGYDYKEFSEVSDEAKRTINRFFEEVYPDESVRRYVIRFHASCLSGRCPQENIHFYTGMNSAQTGANGKSTIDVLMLKLLGEYATVGHPSLLTGSRESANSANSALIAIKNKRLVSFQEINDNGKGNVTLNMQIIKGLTGGDPQSARDLFERQSRPFDPTWKIVVSANKLPAMSNDDGGSRRRVRDIPHEAKFVENPSKFQGMNYVFKMDPLIKERCKTDLNLRLAYLHILIREHQRWREDGLLICERVEAHTLKYLNDQDVYRGWIEEYFKCTGDPNDTIERYVMEELFKTQKKTLIVQFGNIRKDTFIAELCQTTRLGPLMGDPEGRPCWTGWKMLDQGLHKSLREQAKRLAGGVTPNASFIVNA